MATGTLHIDLAALAANFRALNDRSGGKAAAVVKADGYGLGAALASRTLRDAGAQTFFVATSEEGHDVRAALGDGPPIHVFSGHMAGDTDTIRDAALTPMLNSPEQIARHLGALPGAPYGLQ